MIVTINNIEFNVPFDLESIALGDFLRFREQYGMKLEQELLEISERTYSEDEVEADLLKTLDLEEHFDREAITWCSFWTKHNLDEWKEKPEIEPLLSSYRILRTILAHDIQRTRKFPMTIDWMGEEWEIQNYAVNTASKMSFNEIITSKEVIRQIKKLEKSRFEALPYLCAIFLRKKGEAFTDELIEADGERLKLMDQLPMTYAMAVAFFLSSCLRVWKNSSHASDLEEDQERLN
jgi:hypothetical protein